MDALWPKLKIGSPSSGLSCLVRAFPNGTHRITCRRINHFAPRAPRGKQSPSCKPPTSPTAAGYPCTGDAVSGKSTAKPPATRRWPERWETEAASTRQAKPTAPRSLLNTATRPLTVLGSILSRPSPPARTNWATMSTTTTITQPITAQTILRLFPDIDTNSEALDGHDEEQIRLMDEVCIVTDENDMPIGKASKKICLSALDHPIHGSGANADFSRKAIS
jgi:hypothetical protein